MPDAKAHPLNHCALALAQRLIALDAKTFVLTVEGIKDEDGDKIDDIEIVVRYKSSVFAVVPPDVNAALEALERLDASACAGPATHLPEDVETVRLAIGDAASLGCDAEGVDVVCLAEIGYEAAAEVTGCDQSWAQANKPKWIACAEAIARRLSARSA